MCSQISALLIILANIVIIPSSQSILQDLQIVTKSMHLFSKLIEIIGSPAYQPPEHVVRDLRKSATKVVSEGT